MSIVNGLKYLEWKSSLNKRFEDLADYSRIEEELKGVRALFITSAGKVHEKYQESFNQLGIKTRSWALVLEDQRLCHIIAPNEFGLQLYSIQDSPNFLSTKVFALERPSRSIALEDFRRLITQNLSINERLIELTKLVCDFYINIPFQGLLKNIGMVKSESACNCHTCGSAPETVEIVIE